MDLLQRMEAERELKQKESQMRHALPTPGGELLDPIAGFEVDVGLPGTLPQGFP